MQLNLKDLQPDDGLSSSSGADELSPLRLVQITESGAANPLAPYPVDVEVNIPVTGEFDLTTRFVPGSSTSDTPRTNDEGPVLNSTFREATAPIVTKPLTNIGRPETDDSPEILPPDHRALSPVYSTLSTRSVSFLESRNNSDNQLLPDNVEQIPANIVNIERHYFPRRGGRRTSLANLTPGIYGRELERRYGQQFNNIPRATLADRWPPKSNLQEVGDERSRAAEPGALRDVTGRQRVTRASSFYGETMTPWRSAKVLEELRAKHRKRNNKRSNVRKWLVISLSLLAVIGVAAALAASVVLIAIQRHIEPAFRDCYSVVYRGSLVGDLVNSSTVNTCNGSSRNDSETSELHRLYESMIDSVFHVGVFDGAYGYCLVEEVRCTNQSSERATFSLYWRRPRLAPSKATALQELTRGIRTGGGFNLTSVRLSGFSAASNPVIH